MFLCMETFPPGFCKTHLFVIHMWILMEPFHFTFISCFCTLLLSKYLVLCLPQSKVAVVLLACVWGFPSGHTQAEGRGEEEVR